MTKKKLIILCGVIISLILLGFFFFGGANYLFPVQQKPENSSQRVYDYYMILDEANGQTLMYVPLIAQVGDQVLSEENKLYVIVRVEENRAYARFVKDVELKSP